MIKTLRCKLKGHIFVDSRAMPGMQTCVRCRTRVPFEALLVHPLPVGAPTSPRPL